MNLNAGEKIIAIQQPNYVPWQGFFYKIMKSDVVVLLDGVQFSKDSIINRNRIKTSTGEMWLTVPVLTKHERNQSINETRINNAVDWRRKHWNAIRQNYVKSPFFNEYASLLEDIYKNEWEKLAELNTVLIKTMAACLGLEKDFIKASALNAAGKSTDLLVSICKETGGNVYLSGESGKKYMDDRKFEEAGIKIKYAGFKQPVYKQLYGDFIPNLSALDLLFNCGADSRKILEGA
ncbi:MAG: WbqC family protein [Candidatus Omnitrophica bacterium]|nr:WbqC family protein [Candidatus Omnitrophota bacterium]